MSDVISRFERLIDRINVIYGLIIPVALFTLVAILQWIFTPDYFQPDSLRIYLAIIISVAIVFLLHLAFVDRLQRSTIRLLYFYYHAALISFCYFVAPYLSPYEFLWAVLAIGMDLLFGRRWTLLTFTTYLITLAAVFFRTDQIASTELILNTAVQVVGVVGVTLLVSKYRQVSDEERRTIADTSRASAFEHQRLLSLINNMGDAVIATDHSGKILLYNGAVLDLLDTNISLENKSLDSVLNLHTKDKKPVKLIALAKKRPIGLTATTFIHQFSDDDSINLYINISPIKLGFKEEVESGYIIILRDITREKSLEEERDEFISVISHELRTPIAIAEGDISNALFITTKHHDPKTVTNSLQQAHDQVVFLANMINDLATLSRAERTDVKLELSRVNPIDLLQALEADYQPEAKTKKLTLTVNAAPDVQPIRTSELYLREILQNFLTNALKYTKKGSIIVHVRSDKTGRAVFSVADTGIGLSKADQKRVFDKFFRSEDYRTRESSGTGLGLYVTSKLAHRLQATIELESTLNKGTTFTITVPSLKK